MIAFTLSSLSDQTWGILCLALAAVLLLWLLIYRKREERPNHQVPLIKAGGSALQETISLDALVAEYQQRKSRLDADKTWVDTRLRQLYSSGLESLPPEVILQSALPAEIEALAAILELTGDLSPPILMEEIRAAGSHAFGEFIRRERELDPYVPYREVLTDAAKKVKAKYKGASDDAVIERAIIVSTLSNALKKANPQQRALLLSDLDAAGKRMGKGVGGAAGALVVANLSGFGLYVAASTVLGAATSAIGVTLPFAVYTGMSSTIATLIGPVGWAALLVGGLFVLGRADLKRTVPAVIAIGTVRCRLIAQRDDEIASLKRDQQRLAGEDEKMTKCHSLIEKMRSRNLQFIARSKLPF